jgi:hypothetical protein
MNILGSASSQDLSSFLTHAWQLQHQESAFGPISFSDTTNSVASICGTYLESQGYKGGNLQPGLKIHGQDITVLLLNQALEYFQKSLYNYFVQYLLASRGLLTWAFVTNYYSSFFSIHALLCLQGRTLTRISLDDKEFPCQILATNILTHEYIISDRGFVRRGGGHEAAWKRYYEVYDKYTYPISEFESIYKKVFSPDPLDESTNRNRLNYVPFQGFQEMIEHAQMEEFKTMYFSAVAAPTLGEPIRVYLETLKALVTDPNFKHFARVALRLLFAADIFKRLASISGTFKAVWTGRLPLWHQFSLVSFADPPVNFLEDLPQLLGQV